MSAPPPAAPAPIKIPVKIPVGMLPGKLLVKLPPGIPLPTNIPRPAGAPVAAKVPVAAAAPPKPVAKVEVKPKVAPPPPPPKPPVKRPKIEDDEEEDERLLFGAAKTQVKKEEKKPVSSRPSSQSSASPPPRKIPRVEIKTQDEEDVSDEEELSLFARASRAGLLSQELVDDEPEVVEVGPPPRPPQRKFPGNFEAAIEKTRQQLNREENLCRIKDENKSVSLGTSKINYIDPRIVCSWATREKVPLSRLFSATLQKKFPWAMNIGEDYRF